MTTWVNWSKFKSDWAIATTWQKTKYVASIVAMIAVTGVSTWGMQINYGDIIIVLAIGGWAIIGILIFWRFGRVRFKNQEVKK